MLIEITLENKEKVSVNVNHIVFLEPVPQHGGCRIHMIGGSVWYTEESYDNMKMNVGARFLKLYKI